MPDPQPTRNGAPAGPSEEPPRLFEKFRRRAARISSDDVRVHALVEDATTKFGRYKEHLGTLAQDLPVLLRMARAWVLKDYRRVPVKAIVMVVAGLLYFFSPLDAIPDFIPVVGFLDDAAVIAYVLRQVRSEVDRFLEWEAARPNRSAS